MRLFLLTLSFLVLAMAGFVGCGGGEPDVPATLTPEKEQEILDQVEGTAASEEGKS